MRESAEKGKVKVATVSAAGGDIHKKLGRDLRKIREN